MVDDAGPELPEVGRKAAMRDFVAALKSPFTYSWNNLGAVAGLLWGLPVPFFSLLVDVLASGRPFTPSLILERPIHVFFLLHPFLFAVAFGAMGTVRRRQGRTIARLVLTLEKRAAELSGANAKLQELDRLKAEFMANVTHELKTPLVAIRGYAELILDGKLGTFPESQQEGFAIVRRSAERLHRMIDELLEFQKIDGGGLTLAIEEFDLVSDAREAARTFLPQIQEKGIVLHLELPETLTVKADPEKIGRVLLNLLSNAVKFSPPNGNLWMAIRAGERALVRIADEGPGLSDEAQKHLFTRFWQADGSSRRRHGGSGLGLAIVKGILDAHGCAIRISPREGRGTEALFDLPLPAPAAVAEVTP